MLTVKPTIKELLQSLDNDCQSLCNMNLNRCWPDENPQWDKDYFEQDRLDLVLDEVKELVTNINEVYTLDDIKYNNEKIIVKFHPDFKKYIIEYCKKEDKPLPSYVKGKNFLVIGEIAQSPGHFIVVDENGSIVGNALGGFHGYELIIENHNKFSWVM